MSIFDKLNKAKEEKFEATKKEGTDFPCWRMQKKRMLFHCQVACNIK
jgi:hypothetical protein